MAFRLSIALILKWRYLRYGVLILLFITVTTWFILSSQSNQPSFAQESRRTSQKHKYHVADSNHHYGIVIDAGSSGSRLHIYHWPPHTGRRSELLRIEPASNDRGQFLVKKITPGKLCNAVLFDNW